MDDPTRFDAPLFKKLAHNDTGAAAGHQGGMVIPKELDPYFPDLSQKVSAAGPTVDENIRAILIVGDTFKGVVSTRYQYQTWGGDRSPERRITGNLTALRNEAAANDYLVIERGIDDPKLYRMRLLKVGTKEYQQFEDKVGNRKWGPVDISKPPVTEAAVQVAENEQIIHEGNPLDLFDNAAALTESKTTRFARSRAFKRRVYDIYSCRCAVCEGGLASPNGMTEVEAAHIVPRQLKGADDARNGLCLCRTHHWAFDRGLFGINASGKIELPAKVKALSENAVLLPFESKMIKPPNIMMLAPAKEAFDWHWTNVVSLHL